MPLTITPVLAGSGYEYLSRQVWSGAEDWLPSDGNSALDYYASGEAGGERPGVWVGSQAAAWGLAGDPVTRQHMQFLLGAAAHPVTGQLLGRRHPAIRTVEERLAEVDARAAELTPEELEEERARVRAGGERAARGGFDVTLSPPKSVSVLWAAAELPLAEAVWQVHRDAVAAALARLEADAGLTRAGVAGARQIDAGGFAAMAFEHRTSREQDPQIHTHLVLANRVQGADGRWRSLDSRALYRASTAASGVYDATLWAGLARLGVRVMPVQGTGRYEVAGVAPELVALFSTRRRQIEAVLGERLHELTGRALRRAVQVATLLTRRDKPQGAVTSNQLRAGWQQQMAAAGHDPRGVWDSARVAAMGTIVAGWSPAMVDEVVTACADGTVTVAAAAERVLGRDLVADDRDVVRSLTRVVDATVPARTVDAALHLLEEEKGHWTRANAANAVARVLYLHPRLGDINVSAAVRTATERLLADPRVMALTPDDGWDVPAGLRRADGESVYVRAGERVYATRRVLEDLEGEVLAAARTSGAVTYSSTMVDAAVAAMAAEEGGEIPVSVAQQAAVSVVLGRDSRVRALLGAAGAGKTSTLRVVVAAAQRRGLTVVGLAPSQVAARVLGEATGMVTANMAAFASGSPAGAAARAALRPGTLVVVDEAGMAGTSALHRVVTQVLASGGDVLLVGDPDQLGSVGAGGMLASVAAVTDAPTLLQVRRFAAEWEAVASLRLRAGDPAAVDVYTRHGRVVTGTQEDVLARFTAATAADVLAGRDALLVAGSNELAAAAAVGVRALLVHAGRVDDTVVAALADGTRVGVGDLVVTRLNEHGQEVANRDVWVVTAVGVDGSLRVHRHGSGNQPVADAADLVSGGAGGGSRLLRAGYVRAHVQLAYAGTVHAAQGRTVHTGRVLVDEMADRHLLYVGLTRGRERNEVGVVTEPSTEALVGWVETKTAEQVLAEVVARSGNAVSATDARIQQIEQATSIARLAGVYRDLAAVALTGLPDSRVGPVSQSGSGVVAWVRAVDPAAADRMTGDPALPALLTAVAAAARRGVDPRALVIGAATARPLQDADDVAATLHWRIERMAGLLRPVASGVGFDDPAGWVPALLGPPPVPGSGLEMAAAGVAAAAADRVAVLGARVGEQTPAWATGLGPAPGPGAPREVSEDWRLRAGVVAAYRELVGRDITETDPIGPPPSDPDTHRAWLAADAALAGSHLPGRVWRADTGTLRGLVALAAQVEADRPSWVGDRLAAAGLIEAAAHVRLAEAAVVAAVAAENADGSRVAETARDLADAQAALEAAVTHRARLEEADATARAYGAAHRDTLIAGRWAARLLRRRDPLGQVAPALADARRLLASVRTSRMVAPTAMADTVGTELGTSLPVRPLPHRPAADGGPDADAGRRSGSSLLPIPPAAWERMVAERLAGSGLEEAETVPDVPRAGGPAPGSGAVGYPGDASNEAADEARRCYRALSDEPGGPAI